MLTMLPNNKAVKKDRFMYIAVVLKLIIKI